MEYEKYNYKDNAYHKKKRFSLGKKFLIFLSFLFVLGMIFITTIYNGGLPGNVIKNINLNNSFLISLETNIPEIKLEGDYSKITFDTPPNQNLILDEKKILLDKSSNSLIFEGFSGEIEFDEDSINILKGKVSKIYINGVPIINEKDTKMKISLSPTMKYTSIIFKENVYLKEINFISTGKIILGEDILNLNQDEIILRDLFGKLSVDKNKLFFEGLISSLDMEGKDRQISIFK